MQKSDEEVGRIRTVKSTPRDRMVEDNVENAPGPLEKVRPNLASIFPWDTRRMLSGSEFLTESVQRVSSLIFAQIRAIDL